MAFEILSIGDGEMLANAFQGVAMIFGGGHLDKIVKSGFIIGTMIISIRYLTNQEFNLNHVLVGFVVYSAMFIPTVTVAVEDVYKGEVRVVDNIPLGVAVPMSVISTMGVTMTQIFETAFSTPEEAGMMKGGYLSSLNTLLKLRHIGLGTTGSNDGWEGDIGKTINAYIENCVMYDIELVDDVHEVTEEGLKKSPDLWAAMKTTFINIDIMTFFPSQPEGQQKSCNDAYEAMTEYFNDSNTIDKTDRFVAAILGIEDPDRRADERIDKAATALSIEGFESQKFMQNALLASYLKDGPSAFIMRTGQEQLNLQWASEQGMFNEIARPLISFVEMFTVAISPIVAFLTTLGPIGMTMIVRYIQMMLWIALWGPVMAVCNLYITIVTTHALKVIADNATDNGSGLQAMINHDQLYQTLETQLSAGGMLASSVPALSLMIVYGGSVAATNLAGKMTAGASSSVNPSRLMAEPTSIAPTMSIGGRAEYSPNTGAKASGMADISFQKGNLLSRGNVSAGESAFTASSTVSQMVSNGTTKTQSSGSMQSQANSVMSSVMNSASNGSSWSDGTTRRTGDSLTFSNAEKEAVKAAIESSVGFGATSGKTPSNVFKAIMAKLAPTGSLNSESSVTGSRVNEKADLIEKAWNSSLSGGHETVSQNGSSSTNTNQTYSGNEEKSAQAKQFSDASVSAISAIKKYSETSAMMESSGKSMTLEGHQLGPLLNQKGMIPDINQANEALRGKIGEAKYQQLHADAYDEIDGSASQFLMGGDRDALAGFLKLQAGDPVAAAEIFNKAASPTSSGSGVKMSPDEYKGMSKSPEDIVSPETAEGYRAMAHRNEVDMGPAPRGSAEGGQSQAYEKDVDIDADDGAGGGARGSVAKPSAPHVAGNSEHGSKQPADHNAPKSQASSGGRNLSSRYSLNKDGGSGMPKRETQPAHSPKITWAKDPKESDRNTSGSSKGGASVRNTSGPLHGKAAVDNALKGVNLGDPNKRHAQIEGTPLLDSSSVDGTKLVKDAGKIHADAIGDIGKAVADSATKPGGFMNNLAKWGNEGIKEVQDDFNAAVKTSTDSAKEILGIHDKPKSSNEVPHTPSDNDLPPNPKD